MNLLDLGLGESAHILNIKRGNKAERRLFDLGLVPGSKIKLVAKHPFQGPLVLQIGNAKIAIGRRLASALEIEIENREKC